MKRRLPTLYTLPLWLLAAGPASAGVGYGSINNFDAVNDTGSVCHGFEIEIDGAFARDVTYTYDWNHYGTPRITEDLSDPNVPKVFVRYESTKNPDGSWKAYTAIPTGPILPTDGHQFTNPSINFGGEHFGVGFYGTPSAIKYSWLKDDGFGRLTFAGAVNIATPSFTYFAPVPALAQPAQVQAAIAPPPPPAPPIKEFGPASWVKEIRTSSHNNGRVELRELVGDDPGKPQPWANGEPDEVEVEWQILQTDFNKAGGGANGELVGAPEDLNNGDEVITRRYEFFQYVGPIDAETGEALCDKVGADGIHGDGIKIIDGVEVDLSTVVVVGDYVGAQMAGFDAKGQIGLIDNLQDGEIGVPYIDRTMVVDGTAPILTSLTGNLPQGMQFDTVTGVLYGTPTESGIFAFSLHTSDAAGGDVTRDYLLVIVGENLPPTANAGLDASVAVPHDGDPNTATATVLLDGSASADPNGDPLEYVWDDGQGNVYFGSSVALDLPVGVYTFNLTVYDPYGAATSDAVQVTVTGEANQAPLGGDQNIALGQDTSANVTFSAGDPDGDLVSVDQTVGPLHGAVTVNGLDLTYTPAAGYVGPDSVTLTLTDPYGAATVVTIRFDVRDTVAPSITLSGNDPMSVTQGTAFVDPGATANDTHDGSVAVSASGAVNTNVVGSYTVTYTATDAAGNTATRTRTVNVVAPVSNNTLVLSAVTLSRKTTTTTASVTIKNQGATSVTSITISSATLIGVNASTGVPKTISKIGAGSVSKTSFTFKGLTKGQTGLLVLTGTSSQGSFTLSKSVVIP